MTTLVLTGGAVYQPGTPGPAIADVVISGGLIQACGPDAGANVSGRAERIECTGRLVLPGFTDAHVHPLAGSWEALQCNVFDAADAEQVLLQIEEYARAYPEREWIYGGGWAEEHFPGHAPAPTLLDRVTGDRPAYLLNRDHHSVWVNSAVLRLAGITEQTADPPGGRIGRDPSGRLTGVFYEQAMALVAVALPDADPDQTDRALQWAQQLLHQHGIVGWQDAIVGRTPLLPDAFDSYRRLASSGRLTGKVVGAQWWDPRRGLDQLAELIDRRDRAAADGGTFRADAIKVMLDGVCESHTAALLAPYLLPPGDDRDPSNTGMGFIDPDHLHELAIAADAAGFDLHFHALGDRAVRDALDAVAAARDANPPRDRRHHLAHLQIVAPQDVPRFAQLDVTANAQALWACNDNAMIELTAPFLGPERTAQQYPFGSLLRSGARIAFGSDWPVSTLDPMQIIGTAVTRLPSDDPEAEVFLPDERLTLAQALTAATAGSARLNRRSAHLAPGEPADLVILDADPFAGRPQQIAERRAVGTLVDGHWVHRALD